MTLAPVIAASGFSDHRADRYLIYVGRYLLGSMYYTKLLVGSVLAINNTSR